jgi:hypothetical protein
MDDYNEVLSDDPMKRPRLNTGRFVCTYLLNVDMPLGCGIGVTIDSIGLTGHCMTYSER